jgi:hypothetical protein
MDYGVDAANCIHLIRDAAGFVSVRQVSDRDACRSTNQVGHTIQTRRVARVQHHLMPILNKLSRRRPT